MTKIALSTLILLIMTISIKAKETNGWIVDGNMRVGYQNHTIKDKETNDEVALGVNISIKTLIKIMTMEIALVYMVSLHL